MSRIIVAGALANKCGQGGEAWVRLNWLLGLRDIGYDVHFVEQAPHVTEAQYGWFDRTLTEFGLRESATLIVNDGAEFRGANGRLLREFSAHTDLLVNIGGHLTYRPVFERVARRAYVDIDPGFTQFWKASGNEGARLAGHDVHFTIGENIGAPDCPIPTCGIEWHKVRPPVVLSHWPAAPRPHFGRFTTIANWRGTFGPVEFGGVTYGLKVHEFRKVIELPRRAGFPFEIALSIHPGDERDREALHHHCWRLVDPATTTGTPGSFRDYIQNSSAEFSAAQGIYAQTHSGWFSDRTAHYLASGKPALVQATGSGIPTGPGLITFRTLDEAIAGAEDIAGNYKAHQEGARALAEEHFDSRTVLARFIKDALHRRPPQQVNSYAN